MMAKFNEVKPTTHEFFTFSHLEGVYEHNGQRYALTATQGRRQNGSHTYCLWTPEHKFVAKVGIAWSAKEAIEKLEARGILI